MYFQRFKGLAVYIQYFFFLEASGWDSDWGDCCMCVCCVFGRRLGRINVNQDKEGCGITCGYMGV